MAFCNSCGASLQSGAKFCSKCGATQPVSGTVPVAAAPSVSPTTAARPQSSSALKVILIIVAVIVVLGVVGIATLGFVAWRVARHTRIENRNGSVHVESPFGTVVTTTNPEDAAKNLGIDLYPGAQLLNGKAANVSVAGMHTVAAQFETDDSADKVAAFYQSKFPNANVSTQDSGRYSIVAMNNNNLVTISIEPQDGKTVIKISSVTKGMTGGSSN